ncbi:sigma-70 family RNA polymerase sigma factor [Luteibaculum oceani]|uniref:Sigma-70 family RNA polymerase sigma factor n=1 Tax=Luteibaculum oceani TaxID=1294296 RepID=A0A5C6UVI8_9FLAO|nr:sigma-70 family RNA polymerase sigma factor [Luteibaculum oceani]TXC76989.1 sigma-70 family RNA polymerase sigma factor [Luteibaculum oceani]
MSELEFTHQILELQHFLKIQALKITRDEVKAEDLVQDTNLKAIKNRNSYRAGTNIKAWLYTILRNTFINNYRKEKNRKTFSDGTDNSFYIDSSIGSSPLEADHEVNMGEIKNAINQVDDSLRIPFEMFFTGYKYEEIAEELNIPIGTVKSRIFKARKKIQAQLVAYR